MGWYPCWRHTCCENYQGQCYGDGCDLNPVPWGTVTDRGDRDEREDEADDEERADDEAADETEGGER